jgi:hypothetical protein
MSSLADRGAREAVLFITAQLSIGGETSRLATATREEHGKPIEMASEVIIPVAFYSHPNAGSF